MQLLLVVKRTAKQVLLADLESVKELSSPHDVRYYRVYWKLRVC